MRWFLSVLALAACSTPPARERLHAPRPGAPDSGDAAPVLEVITPERGSFAEGPVSVSGRVRDEGPVKVTVAGADVAVAADGTFATIVEVPRGIAIVETHAIDATGHDVRDVRAVLVGPFAASAGAPAGVAARLGPAGLATLGNGLAAGAKAVDYTAAARALNPVYENPGCLGARVDITRVTLGKVAVVLAPKPGAIAMAIAVDDIAIELAARYEVACLGGSTTMTVRTKARLSGELQARLVGERIQTGLGKPDVTLEEFQVDIGGLPGPLHRVVRPVLRKSVETALTAALYFKLPAVADARLAELFLESHTGPLLGTTVRFDAWPRTLELTAAGLLIGAEVKTTVSGGESARYLASAPVRSPGATRDLRVAIGVEAINQLFAGLWAARALDRTLPIDQAGPLRMMLDDEVRTIELAMSLPPTATAEGSLELAIGDLMFVARDAGGAEVQRFAISLRTTLAIKPGELALSTGAPVVSVQLLAQRAAVERPLDAAGIEGLIKGAWWLVDGMLAEPLTRIPLPALGAVEVRGLTATEGTLELELAAAQRIE